MYYNHSEGGIQIVYFDDVLLSGLRRNFKTGQQECNRTFLYFQDLSVGDG